MALKPGHVLAATTIGLLALRWYAARVIGFGDSEALYATYALHPQAAYLDHPGLIGAFASSLGHGTAPTPEAAHVATGLLASVFPLLVLFVARRLGADRDRAIVAALVVAVTPEMAVGLFAMTPDLLLAYLWLAFLGVAGLAFAAEPRSARAVALFLLAGVLVGVATTAKVTGALLLPALVVTAARDPKHRRTPWPWLAAVAALLPMAALLRYEAAAAFPMLRHRLVDTQQAAGFSLRNLGALVGGQIVYVSPVVVVLAGLAARNLIRRRRDSATTELLFWSFVVAGVPLVLLCLWSRVAEPHWLAPPLLALPLAAALPGDTLPRRAVLWSIPTAAVLSLAVYLWVLDPSLLRYAPASYDPKVDITNELFGWRQAASAADHMLGDARLEAGTKVDAWLVGPSWMVCAQLAATLPGAQIGCAASELSAPPTDFDQWAPPSQWKRGDAIVFVTDDRMPIAPEALLPAFHVERASHVTILRGGRVVRVFQLTLLERRAGV